MNRSLSCLLAIALLPVFSFAQSCPCSEQFDWLRQKLALNYSGYRDKVTPKNQDEFERHTAAYKDRMATVNADTTCLRLMGEWARWFHDGHVQLSYKGQTQDDTLAIRARFADWESITLSEADAKLYLRQQGRDSMEGIYQPNSGNYRVALVRNPTPERDFAAIILRSDSVWWMPGQIKFDLKKIAPGKFSTRYYMRDHSERSAVAVFQRGVLEVEGLGAWYKQYPGVPQPIVPSATFTLKQLDSTTLLLRVPTMNEEVRKELDSLLQANTPLLRSTANLIIDCRNNGGGSDITFAPLLPYVFSGPVKGYRSQIYATDDNIQKYDKLKHDKSFPKKYRLFFGHKARQLRRHKGEFVGKCGEYTEKVKKLSPNPQRVAVLINGGCASSCEQFVYYAGQSGRVTLIGQPTAGIVDYGNLHFLHFPCDAFTLAYPTSRSCRVDIGKALDGAGIPPDVPVSAEQADWVELARSYLKQQGND